MPSLPGWSKLTIRIGLAGITAEDVSALVGLDGEQAGVNWLWPPPVDSDAPLQQHPDWLATILRAHGAGLHQVTQRTSADVFIGWTPREQETLVLGADLLQLIADAGLDVSFDAYGGT